MLQTPRGSDLVLLAIRRWITAAPRAAPGVRTATTPPTTARRPAVRILSCSQLAGCQWPSVPPISCPSSPGLVPPPHLHHLCLGMARGACLGGKQLRRSPSSSFSLPSGKSSVSPLSPNSVLCSGVRDVKRLKLGLLTFLSPYRVQAREECGGVEPRLPIQHRGAHLHRQPRRACAAAGRRSTRISSRGGIPKRHRTGGPDPVP